MATRAREATATMANIYKRGKTYWARAQRDGREHRRSLKTTDRRTAESRARRWFSEIEAIAYGDKPRRSYDEAEAKFMAEHLTTIKPSSAKRYGVSLRQLAPHFGNAMLDNITSALLSSFEARRRRDGVSPSSIRRDFACLSSLMASAVGWEWIKDNPVPAYMRQRARRGLKEAPAHTRYLTEVEEAKLLAHATADCRKAITLAIDTGLRREELFSLQWGQVDLLRGLIFTTTRTKSGRARAVPLPPRSAQILGTVPTVQRDGFVLINPKTNERYVQMAKGLAAARRRAGLAKLSWHDLRRTAGCRWLQKAGKSMTEVSVLLGHSSYGVTEKAYAFLEGEQVAMSISIPTTTAQNPEQDSGLVGETSDKTKT